MCYKKKLASYEVVQNKTQNLQALANSLMQHVVNNMGLFSINSKKKIIFNQLIDKLNSIKGDKLSKDALVWLLKNFISVAIMNRYDKKAGETHSAKAFINLLNDPEYGALKELLFSKQVIVNYDDLFGIPFCTSKCQHLLASADYQQELYQSFGLIENKKNRINHPLDSVMEKIVFKPSP